MWALCIICCAKLGLKSLACAWTHCISKAKKKKKMNERKIKTKMVLNRRTYCLTDPPSRQGEHPTTNKAATVLTTTEMWS